MNLKRNQWLLGINLSYNLLDEKVIGDIVTVLRPKTQDAASASASASDMVADGQHKSEREKIRFARETKEHEMFGLEAGLILSSLYVILLPGNEGLTYIQSAILFNTMSDQGERLELLPEGVSMLLRKWSRLQEEHMNVSVAAAETDAANGGGTRRSPKLLSNGKNKMTHVKASKSISPSMKSSNKSSPSTLGQVGSSAKLSRSASTTDLHIRQARYDSHGKVTRAKSANNSPLSLLEWNFKGTMSGESSPVPSSPSSPLPLPRTFDIQAEADADADAYHNDMPNPLSEMLSSMQLDGSDRPDSRVGGGHSSDGKRSNRNVRNGTASTSGRSAGSISPSLGVVGSNGINTGNKRGKKSNNRNVGNGGRQREGVSHTSSSRLSSSNRSRPIYHNDQGTLNHDMYTLTKMGETIISAAKMLETASTRLNVLVESLTAATSKDELGIGSTDNASPQDSSEVTRETVRLKLAAAVADHQNGNLES